MTTEVVLRQGVSRPVNPRRSDDGSFNRFDESQFYQQEAAVYFRSSDFNSRHWDESRSAV